MACFNILYYPLDDVETAELYEGLYNHLLILKTGTSREKKHYGVFVIFSGLTILANSLFLSHGVHQQHALSTCLDATELSIILILQMLSLYR